MPHNQYHAIEVLTEPSCFGLVMSQSIEPNWRAFRFSAERPICIIAGLDNSGLIIASEAQSNRLVVNGAVGIHLGFAQEKGVKCLGLAFTGQVKTWVDCCCLAHLYYMFKFTNYSQTYHPRIRPPQTYLQRSNRFLPSETMHALENRPSIPSRRRTYPYAPIFLRYPIGLRLAFDRSRFSF